jgi:hypothetical protein
MAGKENKKTRGTKKVRKAGKKQRRTKTSKSGRRKSEEPPGLRSLVNRQLARIIHSSLSEKNRSAP